MTLPAKSSSSCASDSSNEYAAQLKMEIEKEIKEIEEEMEEEMQEEIEEEIEEETKKEIEEEIEKKVEEEMDEEMQEETEEEIEEEIEKVIEEEIEKEIEEAIEKEIGEEIEEEIEEETKEIKEEIEEEMEEEIELEDQRNKRIKVTDESTDEESEVETVEVETGENNDGGNVKCSHPVVIKNLCSHCGEIVEEAGSTVAFNYIHKDLRLEASEIEKLQKEYMKNLLKDKKLILVLDLDYTLLNSIMNVDLTSDEEYLLDQLEDEDEPDDMNQTLFQLYQYHMLTKLRPFVHTFLKESNTLFEMYIYTMGERGYATEIAKLLDPGGVYFPSRVICQSDNTTRNQKGLDVVLGSENLVIILDDTKRVWQKHKENLILMKRYHFFAHGASTYNTGVESLSEMIEDENESDGILASILNVLKRAHGLFFDPEIKIDLATRDVRKILQLIKMEILQGCEIVFSKVFPTSVYPKEQPLWKYAEEMGARCYAALHDSVTHVVAVVPTTSKVKWARENNKFVVTPEWIETANFLWKRQKEKDYPVLDKKED